MRERVASTGSLGSVPFRSVSFRRQKTFLSSFVRMSVRLFAVHDPSVHDPFFVFVVESRLRVQSRHYTARRDRGVVDRSTDRSCRSEADWRWVSPRRIAGFTKTTRRRRTNRGRATGIRSETRFVSRVHFHFHFHPPARDRFDLCVARRLRRADG